MARRCYSERRRSREKQFTPRNGLSLDASLKRPLYPSLAVAQTSNRVDDSRQDESPKLSSPGGFGMLSSLQWQAPGEHWEFPVKLTLIWAWNALNPLERPL